MAKSELDKVLEELVRSEGNRVKRAKPKPRKQVVMKVRKARKGKTPSGKTKIFKKRYFIDKYAVNGGVEYEIFTITVPKERATSKKALLKKVNKVVG
jgi:hypothetical protein